MKRDLPRVRKPFFSDLCFALCVALCVALCATAFLSSCSQSDPVIRSRLVQVLRVQGPTGQFAERLSVFVLFNDDDGIDDLDRITVTNEDSGLFWIIRAENALTRSRGDDLWTGSNDLAGPGDRMIPSGAYSVAVSDLAGNESITTFRLVRPSFPDFAPYSFSVGDGQWKLAKNGTPSGFDRAWLFLYDADMNVLYSWRIAEGPDGLTTGTVDQLKAFASGTSVVQCYCENADGSAGVLLTPVYLE